MIRILTVFFLISFTLGCSSPPKVKKISQEKVFAVPFDQVWRAAQIALTHYPIRVNDMDKGILKTDKIHSYKGWKPPHKPRRKSGGLSYAIQLRIVKGRYQKKEVTKVVVSKKYNLKKSFFSEEKNEYGDGLEEKTILYRIQRELQIERAIEKFSQSEQEGSS